MVDTSYFSSYIIREKWIKKTFIWVSSKVAINCFDVDNWRHLFNKKHIKYFFWMYFFSKVFLYHFSLTRQKEMGWLWLRISKPSALTKFETSLALAIPAPRWLGVSPLSAPKAFSYPQVFFTSFKRILLMNKQTTGKTAIKFYHRLPQIQIS